MNNKFQSEFLRMILSLLSLLALCNSFRSPFRTHSTTKISTRSLLVASSNEKFKEVIYNSIALTGFVSKYSNFAEPYLFTKLHEKNKWKSIASVSDDILFAKKRLTTPKNVYSGLADMLEYSQLDHEDLQSLEPILASKEVWLAFNISSQRVVDHAKLASKCHLKRVVLAVNLTVDESNQEHLDFLDAQTIFKEAGIKYTIIKYSQMREMPEAKYPYRIVRGDKALPNEGIPLSDEDLMRVLTEIIDLPKSFDNVYGIIGGSRLDAEILIYMKSQGWPERVQVGLLMGDMMDTIEKKYEEEKKNKSTLAVVAPKKEQVKNLI